MAKNDENQQHSGLIYSEIKAMLADMEKLTKIMLQKTMEAEVITTRAKLNRELNKYGQMARDTLSSARETACASAHSAVAHVRKCPVETAITALSAGWIIWRVLRLIQKH